MLLTDRDSRDPLNWLSRILWPDGSTTIEPGESGESAAPTWWASPSVEGPKILIPAQSRAARTAVKRYHDGFSPKLRLRSLMAELAMGYEPVAAALLASKRVTAIDTSPEPGQASAVLAGIAELIGCDDLYVAVSLSTPKSNQKPVLQLLDGDGRCLGWAKVAWNDRTTALVANEADWLKRTAAAPLSMPALLHDVEIAGRRVAISSGVEVSRRPRRSPTKLPPLEVFRVVSALGTEETVGIERSAWWRSVERVLGHATDRERAAIIAVREQYAGLPLQLGAWHGDLTPWNLMTTKDRVHLIDWEFAADGVPLGFDLCHFHTQVATEMKVCSGPGDDPVVAATRALDYSARLSPHGLAQLGVDAEHRTAVWRLYLVELVRRYLALRANGYPTDDVNQGPAALDRLERAVGSLPRSQAGSAPIEEQRAADAVEQPLGGRRSTDGGPGDDGHEHREDDEGRPTTFAELLASDGDGYTIREHKTGVNAR